MGVPSGNFSSPYAGQLEVTFSGNFSSSSGGDWGTGNAKYQAFLCTVYQGGTLKGQTFIQNTAPSGLLLLDYPGGGVVWTVAMTEAAYQLSGPSSVSTTNLRIGCVLIKK